MPKRKRPRRGSMGYYPKKKARRIYPRIKTWVRIKENKPLGFAGYKAGMTHVILIDNNPNSKTKGQPISKPVTILECPPLSVFGFRCYNDSVSDHFVEKVDKKLLRKLFKKHKKKKFKSKKKEIPKDIKQVNLICHTNPVFKKKPEVFEIAIGGAIEEQLKFAQEILGKEITIGNVFKEGDLIDISAVTKGKGYQGPVKRFGVMTHGRKPEQMKRKVGAHGQDEPGKIRPQVPQAGQLGFQTRTELNKKILKITNGEEVNPKSGFVNFGIVKGECIILEGSIPGSRKRLIRLRFAVRPKKVFPVDIKYISKESKQGV